MHAPRAPMRHGERGHLMVGLVAAVAILMIFSTVVFQEWSQLMRREAEEEMMFRAREIVRGIFRYRIDHGGAGPSKLEQLMEPGPKGQYYMRHLYKDPLVVDGKWGLLYQGPGGTIVDPTSEDPAAGHEQSLMDQILEAPESQASEFATVEGAGAGLTIAGVKSLCKDEPFRVYNGYSDYAEWRFTYLDLETGLATNSPGQQGSGLPSQLPTAGQLGGGDSPFGQDQGGGKNQGGKGKGGGKKGQQGD
jgi:hypothetical protein